MDIETVPGKISHVWEGAEKVWVSESYGTWQGQLLKRLWEENIALQTGQRRTAEIQNMSVSRPGRFMQYQLNLHQSWKGQIHFIIEIAKLQFSIFQLLEH